MHLIRARDPSGKGPAQRACAAPAHAAAALEPCHAPDARAGVVKYVRVAFPMSLAMIVQAVQDFETAHCRLPCA